MQKHLWSAIAILIMAFLALGSTNSNSPSTPKAPKTPEEARKELIEKQFSVWDGSHYAVTKVIKDSMNDPKSYEHVETRYVDGGDHLIVTTTFRGKNAFSGVVKNSVMVKVDFDGNVLKVLTQFP